MTTYTVPPNSSGITLNSGDVLTVSSGGTATGTTVNSGGNENVRSGGVASGTIVHSEAGFGFDGLSVWAGGTASGTILNGGPEYVWSSGKTVSTTVNSGGNQIVFASGAASGTIVNSGGTENVRGTATGTTVNSGGTESLLQGGVASGTVVSNGGHEYVSSGSVATGTIVSSGGVEVVYAGGTATGTTVGVGGVVDVTSLVFSAGGSATVNTATNVLTVTEGAISYVQQLSGSYTGEHFQVAADSGTGTLVTLFIGPPCYCRGTLIRTDRGPVAVEHLRIGDRLATVSGEAMPLKWIGRRSYAGWLAVGNPEVQPIRFKAGALADHVPARDLLVSPEHAMLLDGVLIPAGLLVNGVSILKAEAMEEVHYFHLELERHAVIFAEGAAAESFVDDASRGMFHNVYEFHALYPDAPSGGAAEYCAPRVEDGFALEAVRRQLTARAVRLRPDGTAAPAPVLRGHLERVERTAVEGWAFAPDGPVRLAILADGVVIGRVLADRHRPDLEAAGIGDGRHSFRFVLPHGFARDLRHTIEVRRESDWSLLSGSPVMLEPEATAIPAYSIDAPTRAVPAMARA